MPAKITLDQALSRIRNTHDNTYTFPYIDKEFKNGASKLTAVCKIHGEFVSDCQHLARGQGCPKCAKIRNGNRFRFSPQQALTNLREVLKDKYLFPYIDREYKGAFSKLTVICKIHGEFTSDYSHLMQKRGCPKCRYITIANARRLGHHKILERLYKTHGNRYTYPHLESEYKTVHSFITVTCKIHGDFKTTVSSIINAGTGCPKCGAAKRGKLSRNITSEPGIADYNSYHLRLPITDGATRGINGELQVCCKSCRQLITPTLKQVINRLWVVARIGHGESNFYCSDKCKSECTTYHQSSRWTPKDTAHEARVAKARGCQGKDKMILRQLQIDECGETYCEKCRKYVPSPELHHTIEVAKDPEGSITVAGHMLVCDECHKKLTKQCR